jgi:hypothetical protein
MNKQLQKIVQNYHFKPEDLIDFLQVDVGGRFEADAGVWEKYTVGEHTLMMMRQFERYFNCNILPECLSCGVFRLMLALHDIGKSDAIENGDKNMQHKYTLQIMQNVFEKYDIAKAQSKIVYALVDTDALGGYIRGRVSLDDAAEQIKNSALCAEMEIEDFFNLLSIFYRCDAGSYTLDAGGKESLDYLFIFDREISLLSFAPDTLAKIQRLESILIV